MISTFKTREFPILNVLKINVSIEAASFGNFLDSNINSKQLVC